MKRLDRTQLLIIIGIVVIIIGVVLIVLKNTSSTTSSADSAGGAPAVAEPVTREQLSSDLYDFVNRFYAQYTATPADGSSTTDQHNLALSGFGSQAAIDSFVAEEKQCVQNTPSSVSVDGVTQIDKPYKVGVTYHFTDGNDQQFNVNVTVDNKAYLIDGITC